MNDLSHPPAYADDFLLWLDAQAALLHDRQFDQLDIPNLYEELLGMAIHQRHQLASRLRVLIAHLLKYDFQPQRRSRSWNNTIGEQRDKLEVLFGHSPSLRREAGAAARRVYPLAVRKAMRETGLPATAFPAALPYSVGEILDEQGGAH